MAGISVSQPFVREGGFPIDESTLKSKAEMLATNDNVMPAKYFAICSDDGQLYLYDKSATPNQETGKYTLIKTGSEMQALTNAEIDDLIQNYESYLQDISNQLAQI